MGEDADVAGYEIRTMTRAEVDFAVDLAAGEGWNPGIHDAGPFHAADPEGFLVGTLDGVPVATISVVAYDARFAFLGFYIVVPAHRGRGLGMALWRAGLARLGSRNVGLDGVVAQQDNYRRSGFRYGYPNHRFEGVGGGRAPAGVVDLASVPRDALHAFDRTCFPAARAEFLDAWTRQPESAGRAIVRDGTLRGYGLLRRCRVGHKVGPLFAVDEDAAETLYRALVATVPGEPVYLDVPAPNRAALALARRHGLEPCFETARMYTGGEPEIALDRVYGVTTFELG